MSGGCVQVVCFCQGQRGRDCGDHVIDSVLEKGGVLSCECEGQELGSVWIDPRISEESDVELV